MKRVFAIVILVVQILLPIVPYLSFGRDIWSSQTSVSGFSSTLATYIGIEFALLSVLVLLLIFDFEDRADKKISELNQVVQQYTPLHVRTLKEGAFQRDFLGEATRANHFVNICYFAPEPPNHGGPPPERIKYFKDIKNIMSDNPDIQFKRIVRDTPKNRVWVQQLAGSLRGATNCKIALLRDLDENVPMPLALSVQIIDNRIAWLVAIAEHDGSAMFRDISIENSEVVGMLNKYFERLWSLSRVIFAPGYTPAQTDRAIQEDA